MTTGVNVMTALAVERDGGTIGLLDQHSWVRPKKPNGYLRVGSKADPRPPEKRESDYWLRAMRGCLTRLHDHAPDTVPWFQLDRAGDCRVVLAFAHERRVLLTVRIRG